MRFARMTAPDLRDLSREETLVVAADCRLRAAQPAPAGLHRFDPGRCVADAVEQAPARPGLAPAVLWLGASEHHLPFGGTLTASLATYEQMLVELLTPLLRDGYRRTMLLNGHGGQHRTRCGSRSAGSTFSSRRRS